MVGLPLIVEDGGSNARGEDAMPTFRRLTHEEVAALPHQQRGSVDLTAYRDFLRDLAPGEGGELTLHEGESQRSVKRRLTMAATREQKHIRWRHTKDRALQFVVR
jgi:hypothetical protein